MSVKQKTKKEKESVIDTSDHTDDDIVEHLIVKKGVPIGEDGEVSVVEEYIETRKYNRQQYINSFKDEVGVLNLLRKCNAGLLNPATLAANFNLDEKPFDISDVPTDVGDALAMVDSARVLFASLPADLTAGMSFETFCQKFDQKAFDAYFVAKKQQEQKKEESK